MQSTSEESLATLMDTPSGPEDNTTGTLNVQEAASLFPSFSDDESSASEGVEITAMKCSCIHCVRGDAAVSVPIPVEDDIPIPDPALGAQRKETLDGCRKRMRVKTSPDDADDQKQMQKTQDTT